MGRCRRMLTVALIVCTWAVITPTVQAAPGDTTWISIGLNGEQPNSGSITPDISANGRFITFVSPATNLASGDSWAPWGVVYNVFVHDRQSEVTEKISTDPDGAWANDNSWAPSISDDGRFVAFSSAATNLVSDDDDGTHHIFIRDRLAGTTESLNASGVPQLSGDGRYVAWQGVNGLTGDPGIFVLDRTTTQIERVDVLSNGDSADLGGASGPVISDNGRYVAFVAYPLLTDPSAASTSFVYLRDRLTRTTEIVSLSSDGTPVQLGTDRSAVSGDARYIVFTAMDGATPGDTNEVIDVFVRDRLLGTTERVSVSSDGTQPDWDCWAPVVSADGRFVAFMSSATTLVPGDSNTHRDAFVHDRLYGTTTRVSVAYDGSEADGMVASIAISDDGRFVAFESHASNLTVIPDIDPAPDIYLHEVDQAQLAPVVIAAFDRTWARIDQPIADGRVTRTWTWGPAANTEPIQEPYAEATHGRRTVQYYDKARMELTYPDAHPASPWATTNGLLVVELVSGRLQVGDDTFVTRAAAHVNIAGDPDDPAGPTYATFGTLLDTPPLADDRVITQVVDRTGKVMDDPLLARWDVRAGALIPETGHRVADVFWDYLHASDIVYASDGSAVTSRLFDPWFYASGLPISEAYWTTVRVGGTPREVLVQAFERRVLTYTPGNPDGWQIEAGNVGQHYYRWRHGEPPVVPTGTIAFVRSEHNSATGEQIRSVITIQADGSNARVLSQGGDVGPPKMSRDGHSVAWRERVGGRNDIFVADADGSNRRNLTAATPGGLNPDWSPDGTQIAYDTGDEVWIIGVDGSSAHAVATGRGPRWSPDGSRLAFTVTTDQIGRYSGIATVRPGGNDLAGVMGCAGPYDWTPDSREIIASPGSYIGCPWAELFIVEADGSNLRSLDLGLPDGVFLLPGVDFSPDGTQVVFTAFVDGGRDIYIAESDFTNARPLVSTVSYDTQPSWSPDGKWVVFTRSLNGRGDIVVVNVDDPRNLWNVTADPASSDDVPSW